MPPFEDSTREHEIDEAVPSLRDSLETLDRRHKVLDLNDVRNRKVRDGVDDYHRVVCIFVQEGDEFLQDIRGWSVEHVVLARPRGGPAACAEVHARKVLENRVVPERAVVVAVERGRELLQD